MISRTLIAKLTDIKLVVLVIPSDFEVTRSGHRKIFLENPLLDTHKTWCTGFPISRMFPIDFEVHMSIKANWTW